MGTWKVLFILLLPEVLAKFQFSIPHPEVSASLHTDVLLPCTFSVKNSNNGLKFVIITWKRNGIQLAQYQAETMKDTSRAALLINELPKGDASLLLRNVTISDEGDYECEVHEAPNTRSGNVSLKITATPKVFVKPSLLLVDEENLLECLVEGFYPRNISLEWFKDSISLPMQEPLHFKNNSDGTFSVVNHYNYTPTSSDIGGNLTCQVTSGSQLRHMVEIPFQICKLTIDVSPRTLIKGKEEKVTCKLNGCHFSRANVSWKRNNRTFTVMQCRGTKECESETTFKISTAPQKDVDYSCEAEVDGLGKPLAERVVLNLQGKGEPSNLMLRIFVHTLLAILLGMVVYMAGQIYHNSSFTMSDIDVIHVDEKIIMTCSFSGKQWKFKAAKWRCKGNGEEWDETPAGDSTRDDVHSREYVVRDNSRRRTSRDKQGPVLLSNQKTSSAIYKPKEWDEFLTVQCQVTVVSSITGRTLTKKKEALVPVLREGE
ncbi:titin-like isoform X1 [Erpetoichthys calabaricus]|uniref:titin-like isoform X1 n=2 Tax=Erpetoichthys calabaricus TaxID=27687 RepID=UPI0022348DEC|nr:titin-like isoform X1 [Erpetoichthys calabaricus]